LISDFSSGISRFLNLDVMQASTASMDTKLSASLQNFVGYSVMLMLRDGRAGVRAEGRADKRGHLDLTAAHDCRAGGRNPQGFKQSRVRSLSRPNIRAWRRTHC
jgi:hypothetical protein